MASTSSMNRNNAAVKRIMQEARELANDPSTDYFAAPLEDDIFEWHCTIRGPQGTEFEGGLYHVRMLLPAEYPFRPPSLMVLTPNGRFELNTKICISFTNYHEELWQPAWGVRTAILGLQGFFPLKGQAAVGVGSIEFPTAERKRLATLSRTWSCPHCQQTNLDLLPDPVSNTENLTSTENLKTGETGTPENQTSAASEDTPPNVPAVPTHSGSPSLTSVATDIHVDSAPAESSSQGGPPSNEERFSHPAQSPQQYTVQSTNKSPLLLDTAICVILVLVFALVCRRMF